MTLPVYQEPTACLIGFFLNPLREDVNLLEDEAKDLCDKLFAYWKSHGSIIADKSLAGFNIPHDFAKGQDFYKRLASCAESSTLVAAGALNNGQGANYLQAVTSHDLLVVCHVVGDNQRDCTDLTPLKAGINDCDCPPRDNEVVCRRNRSSAREGKSMGEGRLC